MENINLDFECTHNTTERVMTCSWGRVKLEHYFNNNTSVVLVDDEIKCTAKDLSIEHFMRMQCECQRIANLL